MALLDMYLSNEFKSLTDQELRDSIMSLYEDYLRKEDESRGIAPQIFTGHGEDEKLNSSAILSILHQIATNNKSAPGNPIKMPLCSDQSILLQQLMFDSTHPDLMENFRDQVIQVGDLVTIQRYSQKVSTGIVTDVTQRGIGLYFPRIGWPNQLGYEFFDLVDVPETGWVFSLNYDNGHFREEIPPTFEIIGNQLKDLAERCAFADRATNISPHNQQQEKTKNSVWPWVVGGLALAGGLVWMASSVSRKANPVNPEVEVLVAEARDPNTPFARLVDLREHPEVEVRRAVLDNPNLVPIEEDGKLTTGLLWKLAEAFPEEVASHPAFVLHALVEPDEAMKGVVREVVGRTADAGLIETLWRTWGPHSWRVRRAVARNPNTPPEVLRLLGNEATESTWRVREAVASNPNTPPDVLRILGNKATESEGNVRKAVAQNPSTPQDTLRLLGNEATESEGYVRRAVASNPTTPPEVLRILGNEATESMGYVREAVAENPSTPLDTLRLLGNEATESEWNVRRAVAENPNTPPDVLRLLGNKKTESEWWVREAAMRALAARGLT